MGMAMYYLKARFASEKAACKALPRIQAFLEQGKKAEAWWQAHRDQKGKRKQQAFWRSFRRRFPQVQLYLGSRRDCDCNNGLAGVLQFGDRHDPPPTVIGEIVCYRAY